MENSSDQIKLKPRQRKTGINWTLVVSYNQTKEAEASNFLCVKGGPKVQMPAYMQSDWEISMVVNGQKAWCVAKPAAPQQALQSALDYACNYADCSPTKKGGSCYDPDRPVHHASFDMNAYYQRIRTSTATGKGGNSNPNRYLVCA
ncbi:unnamed protein product [Prunus armeniaca]|uniref:X8 domain-containing protein n=1 Tax=Prunus armeniaca TaxID=36596 RepID=A0A6J5WYB5_PRUAR|nr:unnamed protein product [Prunus armeniaca]CAB4306786.1 unnamed protein product [Prunus armeniaca]